MTTVYLAGPTRDDTDDGTLLDKLTSQGHTVVYRDCETPVGALLAYVCEDVDVVYMMPLWRICVVARAVRAAAIASGVTVRGFE